MATGVLAALASCLTWAWASARFQPIVVRQGALACNVFKALLGSLLFWLLTLGFAAVGTVTDGLGPEETVLLLASGFVGMALGDWAFFAAIHKLGVRQATLLHGTAPVFLLTANLLGLGRSLGPLAVIGVLLVVAGVLDVTRRRAARLADGPRTPFGVGLVYGLLAALGQAAGILMAAGPAARCHVAPVSALRLTGAAVGLLALVAASGRLRRSLSLLHDRRDRLRAMEPVLIGTFLGVLSMTIAIARTEPAIAGALLSLTPVFAIPVSRLLFGEPIRPSTLVGTAVASAGVALVSWR